MAIRTDDLDRFMAGVEKRNPGEPKFHQAVREVAAAISGQVIAPDPLTKGTT